MQIASNRLINQYFCNTEPDVPVEYDGEQWELFVIIPGALLAIVTAAAAIFMVGYTILNDLITIRLALTFRNNIFVLPQMIFLE